MCAREHEDIRIPGQVRAITQGQGEKDALWQAADCLEEAIAGRIADGRPIPNVSKPARTERLIPLPAPMAAKAGLYLALNTADRSAPVLPTR